MSLTNQICSRLLLATVILGGCSSGGDHPETAPVSGTVLYKGDPVEGATVSFRAEGAPRPASGVTNAEGKFQLSTFDANDGAVLGEHIITVTKMPPGSSVPAAASDSDAMLNDPNAMMQEYQQYVAGQGKLKDQSQSLLPAKYADPKTTPLKETVTREGPNQFVLQLTD